ncbi:MAG: hypothetical protein GY948_17290 [Alphaproteobacteria bacterium]|nr:hypothetical protein [Alphaproteobacteria bacterium]
MPVDTNAQNGSDGEDHLRELVLAIEKAQKLANAGRHKFLTYLLDMARLEVNGLRAKGKE